MLNVANLLLLLTCQIHCGEPFLRWLLPSVLSLTPLTVVLEAVNVSSMPSSCWLRSVVVPRMENRRLILTNFRKEHYITILD